MRSATMQLILAKSRRNLALQLIHSRILQEALMPKVIGHGFANIDCQLVPLNILINEALSCLRYPAAAARW